MKVLCIRLDSSLNFFLFFFLLFRVKDDDPKLMEDPIVTGIATKKGKSPAQILIRFCLERGVICIPKSVTPSRIQANFEVSPNSVPLQQQQVFYIYVNGSSGGEKM